MLPLLPEREPFNEEYDQSRQRLAKQMLETTPSAPCPTISAPITQNSTPAEIKKFLNTMQAVLGEAAVNPSTPAAPSSTPSCLPSMTAPNKS